MGFIYVKVSHEMDWRCNKLVLLETHTFSYVEAFKKATCSIIYILLVSSSQC